MFTPLKCHGSSNRYSYTTHVVLVFKVSLLEYRKRQQEARGSNSKSDCLSSDLSKTPSNMGTPTRRNSDGTCAQSATNGDSTAISRSRRSSSPPSGFSSPVHASVPQVEEVSPSDPASSRNATLSAAASIKSRNSMSTRWWVYYPIQGNIFIWE